MKGYQAIPALVERIGAPAVFTVLASTNAPYLAAGLESGAFRVVKTRHEETATAAAMAYSRATGKIGIASVQRGPGLGNSLNALMVGQSVHAPALLLVAESPATKDKTGKDNVPQREIIGSIGVGFHHVAAAADLESGFLGAVRAAEWNGAPQVLSIGDGILAGEVDLIGRDVPPISDGSEIDPVAVSAAVDALEASTRPLILGGHGVVHADCRDELIALAELVGARLANSFYGMRLFSGHPADLGLCGTWAPTLIQEQIAESDVVVGFGASLNRHTTIDGSAFGGAKVIHVEVDIDQPSFASSPDLAILGDAKAAAKAMIDEWRRRGLAPRPPAGSIPTWDEIGQAVVGRDVGHDPDRGVNPLLVYKELDRRLPQDRVVVTDSGRHISPILSLVAAGDARSFINSRGYGSVGLGIAAAIGAGIGHPDRPITLICGDGGFTMAAQELDTIRRYVLDVTIVIINDLMYGAEVRYLRRFGLPPDVLEMSFPDVDLLARAYGGRGVRIDTIEDLDAVDLGGGGLLLVDVRVDPEIQPSDGLG